jgi:hypothetical protein
MIIEIEKLQMTDLIELNEKIKTEIEKRIETKLRVLSSEIELNGYLD